DALKKGANKDYKVVIIPKANHLFQEATTGSPSEYATLKKEFIPGFLETVSEWILQRVTIIE
ncbi:MAG TPA: alpha/beta hydrolase, partial [Ignavibacteria bacterium]|nr:alpha/beta hydrolase [Ignavibacteria bacterium]